MSTSSSKLFVLDTNVILHDAGCLRSFEDNDIAIPITVLEELDRFKRGTEDINFQAREFLRVLDSVSGDMLSPAGAEIGDGLGSVRVLLDGQLAEGVKRAFFEDTADHRILSSVLRLRAEDGTRPTILVTKDTNLRVKAKALGIPSEDYSADKVRSFDELYTGRRTIEDAPPALIDALYQAPEVDAEDEECLDQPRANENFVLRNGSKSVLARFHRERGSLERVAKLSAYGIRARNAEQAFALAALLDDDIKLVTISGRAGTGKTLLALAAALERRQKFRQILLARPVVPLSNRDLGFLPGDIDAKLDPYMQPLFDALAVIRDQLDDRDEAAQRLQKMRESEKLLISPLAYIRGRSLQRVFFIVDEAQNLTPHEVKTIVTRAGEGTKVVLTGDIQQIDQPYLDALSNGMSYVIHRMVGQDLYAHVTLEKGERSELADVASELL